MFFPPGTSVYADSIYRHIIGCKRIRVSLPTPLTVPVYCSRPPTTCASYLPSDHGVLGHKTIPLVCKECLYLKAIPCIFSHGSRTTVELIIETRKWGKSIELCC